MPDMVVFLSIFSCPEEKILTLLGTIPHQLVDYRPVSGAWNNAMVGDRRNDKWRPMNDEHFDIYLDNNKNANAKKIID
jgi:hypothetical protein